MKIKDKVLGKSTFSLKGGDQIIMSPETNSYSRKQVKPAPMPEVQLDFKKGPGSKNKKESQQQMIPVSSNRRLTPINFSNGKYNKLEEDLKIPLNNPHYNEMMNTQIDNYNYYQNQEQNNNFMSSHQYMHSQSNYMNNQNLYNDFNGGVQHSQYQGQIPQFAQQQYNGGNPFSPTAIFSSPKFASFYQNLHNNPGRTTRNQFRSLKALQQNQMIAQANSKFSPLNTNHQLNLLESPGDHNTLFGLSNFNKHDNLHSSQQLRLGGVQSTSASGNGMFGNGNEISPLYRKREVQLLIGGNIESP